MVLILLVSTLQFSIYKMECLMSGNTQLSLSDFDDCNQNTTNNCISAKCCDFDVLVFDFEYLTNINNQNFSFIFLAIAENFISTTFLSNTVLEPDYNFYTNLPPPSGYELLKVVQVFRI